MSTKFAHVIAHVHGGCYVNMLMSSNENKQMNKVDAYLSVSTVCVHGLSGVKGNGPACSAQNENAEEKKRGKEIKRLWQLHK